jgi:DNA-binding MarR family transcriptional regulator
MFGLFVLVGAELAEVPERLVRCRASMTLAQLHMIELMADRNPVQLEPWRLAETLGLASNHVSLLLDQLAAQALVKRHAHPGDAPRRLIEITAPGASGQRV